MSTPRTLVALCALAMLAAACSGDGAGSTPDEDATPAASMSPGAAATGDTPAASPTASATAAFLGPTTSTATIPRDELPVVEFVTATGAVVPLAVEVPPRDEYSIGLMNRPELVERGMLFYYDPPRLTGFYMKNVPIDLDIAFVGADGTVQEIRRMEAQSLEIIRPEREFQFAVEAPPGWYEANGIASGDRMRLTFELPSYLVGGG